MYSTNICFRFCKQSDENKRQKVALILDKLITMTIEEVDMYPSIQSKIWGNIGQIGDLLDMVLDSFIKVDIVLVLDSFWSCLLDYHYRGRSYITRTLFIKPNIYLLFQFALKEPNKISIKLVVTY